MILMLITGILAIIAMIILVLDIVNMSMIIGMTVIG